MAQRAKVEAPACISIVSMRSVWDLRSIAFALYEYAGELETRLVNATKTYQSDQRLIKSQARRIKALEAQVREANEFKSTLKRFVK